MAHPPQTPQQILEYWVHTTQRTEHSIHKKRNKLDYHRGQERLNQTLIDMLDCHHATFELRVLDLKKSITEIERAMHSNRLIATRQRKMASSLEMQRSAIESKLLQATSQRNNAKMKVEYWEKTINPPRKRKKTTTVVSVSITPPPTPPPPVVILSVDDGEETEVDEDPGIELLDSPSSFVDDVLNASLSIPLFK